MIVPLKYKPVNWIDGMKLSSEHFVVSDLYHQDLIRDAGSVFVNNFNYGLLPPQAGQAASYELELIEKATGHVEIRVRHCNAITPEGCRIDLSSPAIFEDQLSNVFDFSSAGNEYAKDGIYNIVLRINPFERIPSGNPDPKDNPPRYPDISKAYSIYLATEAVKIQQVTSSFSITVGQLIKQDGKTALNNNYIPPSSSVSSHPALLKYYESFNLLIHALQNSAFKIADKTSSKDAVTPLGRNIRLLSEKLLDYIAQLFFNYRNLGYQQSPIVITGYCSTIAHVFFTAIKLIEQKEREEILKYFYEWKDVTPGNFEELLARMINQVYDHENIYASMSLTEEFLKVMTALWDKLSSLEYLGQRRENIIVAEQQMVQQVQTKKTWTLLD